MNSNSFSILGEQISDESNSENEDNKLNKNQFFEKKTFLYDKSSISISEKNFNIKKKKPKKENHKKILCHNMISSGKCCYGDKCLYAHDFKEQKLEPIREKAYNILSNKNLKNLNIYQDKELYKTLLILSHVCENCINNKCTGGYNCKYGSCKKDFVICSYDLNNKNCDNKQCNKIHLTDYGLVPYFNHISNNYEKKKKYRNRKYNINARFFYKYSRFERKFY